MKQYLLGKCEVIVHSNNIRIIFLTKSCTGTPTESSQIGDFINNLMMIRSNPVAHKNLKNQDI